MSCMHPLAPSTPAIVPQSPTATTQISFAPRAIPSPPTTSDVTRRFEDAASALRTGQLVKDEFFTLFEAVSALEIMDSKMDSGHLEEGETLEEEYDVMRALQPKEVIGIMDQLLCLEVAWHMGYPLSQTLFTSTYINRLLWPEPASLAKAQFYRNDGPSEEESLVHKVLRSYCLGTIKACDFVHTMVSDHHYYEEEDFATQLFHRELLHRIDPDDVQLLLDDALTWIEGADINHDLKAAMECRLIFRQDFLNSLQADRETFPLAPHSSLSCLPLLTEIGRSASLGERVEQSFSMKIQRTLASSVPPRPMVTIQFIDAVSHLERLCCDATDVYQLYSFEGNQDLLTAFWTFMSHQPYPSVYIRTLAQSFLCRDMKVLGKLPLKDFIVNDLDSLILPGDLLLESVRNQDSGQAEERSQVIKLVNDFIARCSQPYLNYFRTACLNRCRIRRTLCHACVEWDALQAEAEELDTTLRMFTSEQAVEYAPLMPPTYSYPLSSWTYHYKLLQLEQIIQMGFELSIYAPDEFCGMYWYLSHVCTTHISQLDRMSFFVGKTDSAHTFFDDYATQKSAALYGGKVEKALQRLFRNFTRLKATEAFARALHRLFTVLIRHGLVAKPLRPYASDKLRHELRMKPFLPLSIPEPMDFMEFERESSISGMSDLEALDDASEAITDARKSWEAVLKSGWASEHMVQHNNARGMAKEQQKTSSQARTTVQEEWTSGVKNTLRACIATSIAAGTLGKALRRLPNDKTPFKDLKVRVPNAGDKDCYHGWWLVPRVSES